MGITDPALYFHFKGKQAIFEALLKMAGPELLANIGTDPSFGEAPAHIAIPKIFGDIVSAWTTPRARAFTSLVLRMGPDGIGNTLKDVATRLHPIFETWKEQGDLRDDVTVEVARFDVVMLIEFEGIKVAERFTDTPQWKDALASAKQNARNSVNIPASNTRHIGPVDHSRDGIFLFNYFYADNFEHNNTAAIPILYKLA